MNATTPRGEDRAISAILRRMVRGGGPGSRFAAILLVSALTGPVLALAVVTTPSGPAAAVRAGEAQFARSAAGEPRPGWLTEPSLVGLVVHPDAGPEPVAPSTARSAAATAVPEPPRPAPVEPTPSPPPATAAPPPSTTLPSPADPLARARAALDLGVPVAWRTAITTNVVLSNDGVTASRPDGRIRVALEHATGDGNRLVAIMAHEFGHLVAYAYGNHQELGAAPDGWPRSGAIPVEHWADCVARAWTGTALASHGQAPCDGDALGWATTWLAAGPAAHPRTA